jgi:hypothetical protein
MTTFFAALLAAITFGTVWGWIIFVVAFIIINDPIRKIFRTIYTHIATSLQKISDRMFKGAMADLALAKEAEEAEKAKQEERVAGKLERYKRF